MTVTYPRVSKNAVLGLNFARFLDLPISLIESV